MLAGAGPAPRELAEAAGREHGTAGRKHAPAGGNCRAGEETGPVTQRAAECAHQDHAAEGAD